MSIINVNVNPGDNKASFMGISLNETELQRFIERLQWALQMIRSKS